MLNIYTDNHAYAETLQNLFRMIYTSLDGHWLHVLPQVALWGKDSMHIETDAEDLMAVLRIKSPFLLWR